MVNLPSYFYEMNDKNASLRIIQDKAWGKRDVENICRIEIVKDGKVLDFQLDKCYLGFLIGELRKIEEGI